MIRRVKMKSRERNNRPVLARLGVRIGTLIVVLVAVTGGMCNATARAQETWEYSPYQVQVWLAVLPSARLPETLQEEILTELRRQAPLFAGATWRLVAEKAPESIAPTLVTVLDALSLEQIAAVAEDALAPDKLMLLTVAADGGEFLIACRELDCHARSFGQVFQTRGMQLPRLPRDCAMTMARAFAPLVRVEQSRGRSATARVRAGGLVRYDHCISRVKAGDVLRPVIRRNDRRGQPKPGGIQEVDWTYLTVRSQDEYLLQCEVLSAMRNPLAGRSSVSVEKLALLVQPQRRTTELKLVAKDADARPLEGYEIFAKKPLPKDADVKNTALRLGSTDWRGTIEVPPDELTLRLIYVKNGTHLIARLPVVPGYLPQVVLELPSDDKRLEAEAFVQGMESTVMDLVARREILTARIERRIGQGNLEDARALLDEIKSFQTKDDLEIMLSNRQQAGLSSENEREQRRIDQMLSGTRILLNKYLDPDQLVALQRQVEQAEKSPGRPATKKAAAKKVVAEAEASKTPATKAVAEDTPAE